MDIISRILDANRSFMRMPLWVRLWVVLGLGGANLGAFFFLETGIGLWTALAALFVLAFNTPMLLIQRGWGKILAFPHLVVWPPLLAYIAYHLFFSDQPISATEYRLGVFIFIINGISILFDINDAREWINGKREVA